MKIKIGIASGAIGVGRIRAVTFKFSFESGGDLDAYNLETGTNLSESQAEAEAKEVIFDERAGVFRKSNSL